MKQLKEKTAQFSLIRNHFFRIALKNATSRQCFFHVFFSIFFRRKTKCTAETVAYVARQQKGTLTHVLWDSKSGKMCELIFFYQVQA